MNTSDSSSDARSNASTQLHPRRDVLHGAYCPLTLLTGARFAAAQLSLPALLNAQGNAGAHRARARGRGLEFEEVRAYQAGDDIRSIDWRVTARSGRPFTKQFREERERPLLLMVDQRQPMFFGSRTCFKSTLAAYLGALIGWAGLQGGDRIGGLIIGNDNPVEIRPRHTRTTAMAWLQALHASNHLLTRSTRLASGGEESLLRALTDLRRSARPGSSLFLISDFYGAHDERVREQLHRLAQHVSITALHIYDPLERELPPPARYQITDGTNPAGHQRLILDSGDTKLRQKHREHFDAHVDFLKTLFSGLGTALLSLSTAEPPLTALDAALHRRNSLAHVTAQTTGTT